MPVVLFNVHKMVVIVMWVGIIYHTRTHTTILWPLYRSTCVRWQLRTRGFLLEQSFTAHMPLMRQLVIHTAGKC